MKTKSVLMLLFCIILHGCSGYRYSVVEDDKRYLLEGQFYNNNPFIKVKAIIPHNFIIEKTNQLAREQDIYQFMSNDTPRKDTTIVSGFIEDKHDTVLIKLMTKNGESGATTEALENGSYKLQSRLAVEDICSYIEQKYSWLKNNKTLNRGLTACGFSAR